jgi:hypothetical protein
MKKLLFLAICAGFLLSNVFSQEVTPTATPAGTEENSIKIPTTLIQVDVSVTDEKGRIIDDLRAEDFEVYENGGRQNVTTFSFISNVRTRNETSTETKNNPPVPIPAANLRPEAAG